MKFWTDPHSSIPQRVLLNTTWRGGHRHGNTLTQEQKDYDRWWRKRVVAILSAS